MPSAPHDPDYVTIDVAAAALGVRQRRALQLAKSEGWKTEPDSRPTRYRFTDIARTHKNRKEHP